MYASTHPQFAAQPGGAPAPAAEGDASASAGPEGVESSALLERLDLESLFFNVDAALGVRSRGQFFSWTQGLLQGLIRHEVLVCAMRSAEPLSFRVESFSSTPVDPAAFGKLVSADAALLPALAKAWEAGQFQPLVLSATDDGPFAGTAFAREMEGLGATCIVVHGTHDVNGCTASLFLFAARPLAAERMLDYLARFVVPFLNAAWVRSHVVARGAQTAMEPAPRSVLTGREREILRWIYLGKSNFEIGAILTISPLTVKNHVRKILRKLDVVNRTQAVGRGLELRILNL